MEIPRVRYARSGDVSIAYTVVGSAPIDLLIVHGLVGNVELSYQHPTRLEFVERLAEVARVIEFDRRGTGLSDRVREVPTLEARMDDVRAVLAAAGSERAALFGTFEAASMTALFAATYPERVAALVLYNAVAKGVWSPDYPYAPTAEEWRQELDELRSGWGDDDYFAGLIRELAPSRADDAEYVSWYGSLMRQGASPGAAAAVRRMAMDVDIRDVLPSIRVPTLLLHRPFAREENRYIAERIPGARRVEIGGPDTPYPLAEGLLEELRAFVESSWGAAEPETVLATVLFTDIVGSTAKAAALGDAAWRELVTRHHAIVRGHLDRFRGKEVDTAGDGFFATFDGPARAIRCAAAVTASVRDLGLEVRAGLHTGECELIGEKVGGIAVAIGARVAALAAPGEVLVSGTVKDLVAGSGIGFRERGSAELKGVPGEWRLFAVER